MLTTPHIFPNNFGTACDKLLKLLTFLKTKLGSFAESYETMWYPAVGLSFEIVFYLIQYSLLRTKPY